MERLTEPSFAPESNSFLTPHRYGSALERQLGGQRARRPADPLLSLVVPVFNEEESIDIFLDDGRAADGARRPALRDRVRERRLARQHAGAACSTAAPRDRRLRVVNLSRNFGKEAALTAGLDHARGDAVMPIDADLQDPPELIGPGELARRLRGGLASASRAPATAGQAAHRRLVLPRINRDAGADPGRRRRFSPAGPAGRRGPAAVAGAQALHEGPVRLGRL